MRNRQFLLGMALVLAIAVVAGCGGGKEPQLTAASQRFTDWGYTVWFTPGGDHSFTIEEGPKYAVYPTYYLSQYVSFEGVDVQTLQSVGLRDVKVTRQPELGEITFSFVESGAMEVGEDYIAWNGYAYSQNGSLDISFTSSPLGTLVLGADFEGTHSVTQAFNDYLRASSITADDLRFRVSFRVEIIDQDGKLFVSDKEIDILPGDFLKEGTQFEFEMAEPFMELQ